MCPKAAVRARSSLGSCRCVADTQVHAAKDDNGSAAPVRLIERADDAQLYKDAYEEPQRIIRISDEVRILMERVTHGAAEVIEVAVDADADAGVVVGGCVGHKAVRATIKQMSNPAGASLMERVASGNGDGNTQLTPRSEPLGLDFELIQQRHRYIVQG